MDENEKTPKEISATNSYEVLSVSSRANDKAKELRDKAVKKLGPLDSNKVTRGMLLLLIVLVVGFGGGWLGAIANGGSNSLSSASAKEIVSSQKQLIPAIVSSVSPSVVSIDATATTTTQNIFGLSTPTQEESEGTGIIISSSGYIITNRHVIPSGTTSVSVVLNDGTTINNVKVVGTTAQDDSLDIGFLKINNPPETLQPALLGNSGQVQVGDSVVAIGNALGQFQNTVTSGIISGRGRSVQAGDSTGTTSEDLQDLFQTDAAINEGNSGGPLINDKGEVIGINTATASTSDGAQNIGFAIPINDAEGLIKGVLATGKIERPYLGVYFVPINAGTAQQYHLNVTSGAYIPPNQQGQVSVLPNSPASNAGLQAGDIIQAINGVQIDSNNSLSSLIDQQQVGTKVTITILRSGLQKTLTATIGNEPAGS